mmetsp:Transcript_47631/g.153155  ORF Transcript_47631/g.153155 Transcript_47631/m.153155 type:complete len:267 (+) Transcript_47631:448-1248(+)
MRTMLKRVHMPAGSFHIVILNNLPPESLQPPVGIPKQWPQTLVSEGEVLRCSARQSFLQRVAPILHNKLADSFVSLSGGLHQSCLPKLILGIHVGSTAKQRLDILEISASDGKLEAAWLGRGCLCLFRKRIVLGGLWIVARGTPVRNTCNCRCPYHVARAAGEVNTHDEHRPAAFDASAVLQGAEDAFPFLLHQAPSSQDVVPLELRREALLQLPEGGVARDGEQEPEVVRGGGTHFDIHQIDCLLRKWIKLHGLLGIRIRRFLPA